jgi:hypothetical protein
MRSHDVRWTAAWLLTVLALAAHAADEVLHGSYGLYEDWGRILMALFPSFEMPPFKRELWLANLGGALAVLLALTWLVWMQRGVMIVASYALAAFATLNGALHLLIAAALKTTVPGALSAPLLVATGLFLFIAVPRRHGNKAAPGA